MKGTVLILFLFVFIFSTAQQPQLVLPVGHTQNVFSIEYSADGKYILTLSYDKTAKVWEASSGRLLNSFENLRQSIGDITNWGSFTRFSTTGEYIFGVDVDGSFNKWETLTGKLVFSFPFVSLKKLQFGNGGNFIINDDEVRDGSSGNLLYKLEKWDQYSGTFVEASPIANLILVIKKNSLFLRDAKDGKIIHQLDSIENFETAFFVGDVSSVAIFTKNSNFLRIWNTKTGELSPVRASGSVRFSPVGDYLLGTYKGHTEIIDIENNNLLYSIVPSSYLNEILSISDNNKYLYLHTPAGFIRGEEAVDTTTTIWNAKTGQKLFSLTGHRDQVLGMSFSRDGRYMASVSFIETKVWNAASGQLIKTIETDERIKDVQFNPDGQSIAIVFGTEVEIYNLASDFKFNLKGQNPIVDAGFTPDGLNMFTVSNETNTKIWQTQTGMLANTFKERGNTATGKFSVDGKLLILETNDSNITARSHMTGEEIYSIHHPGRIGSLHFSPEGDYFVTTVDSTFFIWHTKTGKFYKRIEEYTTLSDVRLTKDAEYAVALITSEFWSSLAVWNVRDGKLVYKKVDEQNKKIRRFRISPDGKYLLAIADNYEINLFKLSDGNLVKQLQEGTETERAASYLSNEFYKNLWRSNFESFSADGKYLMVRGPVLREDKAIIWDLETLASIDTLSGHSGIITSASFLPQQKLIITSANDNKVKLWSFDPEGKKQKKALLTIEGNGFVVSPDENHLLVVDKVQLSLYNLPTRSVTYKFIPVDEFDYFTQLPDKMIYSATKNGAKKLSFRQGKTFFSFDAFDLQFNRPHEILKRAGNKDTALIRTYENAWKKRLGRAGFKEKDISSGFHVPAIRLINHQIPAMSNQRKIYLGFKASDSRYKLDRYYVYVNDVPVNGVNGTSIKDLSTKTFEKMITVDLSTGINNIQFSCRNEKGVESRSEMIYTRFQPADNLPVPKTWFIGIGVDNYIKDTSRNLDFAGKDIRDIDSIFKLKDPSTISKLFIDSTATRINILALKELLKTTAIDDKVIIALSGHGLRDRKGGFYFGTYDINFKDPSKEGLKIEELEDLLDGIPARKRLLLIDACHSGELDTTGYSEANVAVQVQKARIPETSGKTRTGDTNDEGGIGLQNSIDVMKQLFADISGNNGTVVISAAKGFGFAEENKDWGNGAFTLCFKAAFSGDERFPELNESADLNGDGVSINELKEYILTKVPFLTKERQQPTTRRENLLFDWKLVNSQ